MKVEDVLTLLHQIGCSKIRVGNNGWVHSSCPFAPVRHTGGKDNHPSFGVAVSANGRSHYKCHTCSKGGALSDLVWALESSFKKEFPEIRTFISAHESGQLSNDDMLKECEKLTYDKSKTSEVGGMVVSGTMTSWDGGELKLPVLPESDLDVFREVPDELMEYFTGTGKDARGRKKRGLSKEAVVEWELGWHAKSRRWSVPIRDMKKRLVGISGRAYDPDTKPKFLHSTGFKRDYYLYGEHKIDKVKRLFIVEGFIDVVWLWMHGYPAVAVMGSYLSRFQIEKLQRFCQEAVIVPDGDEPGYEAADRELKQLLPKMMCAVADVPEGSDPDDLSKETLLEILGPPPKTSTST